MERQKLKVSDNCVALIGKPGSGKTTIYNKLCKTNHFAGYSKGSATREIRRSEVAHGNQAFTVLDTPGYGAREEPFKHALLLKEALTCQPLNALIIVIPFSPRIEDAMQNDWEETIRCVRSQKTVSDRLILLVSKFDHCDGNYKDQAAKDIREVFTRWGVVSFVFSGNELNPRDLANDIYEASSIYQSQVMLKITDADLLKDFDLYCADRIQLEFMIQLRERVDNLLNDYMDLLSAIKFEPDKDTIIMEALAFSRFEVEAIKEEFVHKFRDQMISDDYYAFYIKLQSHIIKRFNDLKLRAYGFMSYNPDDKDDPRNQIRSCYHCGEIWIKVAGCEGITTCGNRGWSRQESIDEFTEGKWFSGFTWYFKKFNGKLGFFKNSQKQEKAKIQAKAVDFKERTDGRGCGKNIRWTDCKRVPEEQLLELFSTDSLDAIAIAIAEQKEFSSALDSHRKSLNFSISK